MKAKNNLKLIFLAAFCYSLIFIGCGETDSYIDEKTIFFENPKEAVITKQNNEKLDLGEDDSSGFARFYHYSRNTNIGHPTVSSWSYYLDPGIGYPLPLIDHPYYTRSFFSNWLYRYYSY